MFTSLRAPAGLRGLAALGLGLLLAGCAAPARPVATTSAEGAGLSGPVYATVDLVRPVPAGTQTSGALLAALGLPGATAGGARSEVLLRTDDGQRLSVVTPDASGMAPGTRVVVLPGSPLRIGRPGFAAPAS